MLSSVALEIEVDPDRSRLWVYYRGRIGPEVFRSCAEEALRLAESLGKGFEIYTDFTELEWMDYACASDVKEMMNRFARLGVRSITRIMPDPRRDIGFAIMSAFHYPPTVRIRTFRSREEALGEVKCVNN